jgi:hypothetical protein
MFSWGQTHDERWDKEAKMIAIGKSKKHADDTGDYKKTDQGKEKAKAVKASFFRSHFADIRRS